MLYLGIFYRQRKSKGNVAMKDLTSYAWFVEPAGKNHDRTNGVISQILPPENAIEGVVCADGERHNLWRCTSWETIGKLQSCSSDMGLHFRVWVQEGRHGKIRHWALKKKQKKVAIQNPSKFAA